MCEFEVVVILNKRVKYDFAHHRNVPLWNVFGAEVEDWCCGLFNLPPLPLQEVG